MITRKGLTETLCNIVSAMCLYVSVLKKRNCQKKNRFVSVNTYHYLNTPIHGLSSVFFKKNTWNLVYHEKFNS